MSSLSQSAFVCVFGIFPSALGSPAAPSSSYLHTITLQREFLLILDMPVFYCSREPNILLYLERVCFHGNAHRVSFVELGEQRRGICACHIGIARSFVLCHGWSSNTHINYAFNLVYHV